MKTTKVQQEILNQIALGETAIVSTSQYTQVQYNPESLKVIYGGTAAAINGLVKKGLVTSRPSWRCATVTRIA